MDTGIQIQEPVAPELEPILSPEANYGKTNRGFHVVPSWGGDMFEALMPDLFVPESAWGPRSWRVNHPLTVRAQIEHGLALDQLVLRQEAVARDHHTAARANTLGSDQGLQSACRHHAR